IASGGAHTALTSRLRRAKASLAGGDAESAREWGGEGTAGRSVRRAVRSEAEENMRALGIIRSYLWVVATLLALVVTLVLELTGSQDTARWLPSAYGLMVVTWVSVGMVKGLMRGHWGIDILAVTAILSTILVGEHIAALIVCLMLTGGEALEDYAASRAKKSLSSLLERAPQVAHRLQHDGSTVDVPLEEGEIGDRLLVRPAEVVPVDGILSDSPEGETVEADFDESSLTGESLPVTRRTGEEILSGALNGQQAVVVEATAAAKDSQFARIVELVSEASESRAPMVRLADRYAVPFTLAAYAIGGIAWAIAPDPVRFAEVLVVATPCPLLIAPPVASLGGTPRAARTGVRVKSGGPGETLGRVRTAAFDKTGTLTYGRPELLSICPAIDARGRPVVSPEELLRLTGSAEQYSVHVLADTIRAAAAARGLELISASEDRKSVV